MKYVALIPWLLVARSLVVFESRDAPSLLAVDTNSTLYGL